MLGLCLRERLGLSWSRMFEGIIKAEVRDLEKIRVKSIRLEFMEREVV